MGTYSKFLKDVILLSWTAFGGPQAHIALMLDHMVGRRKYLTEEELIELNALCQLLPGPTSTQTLTSIGYKVGGPKLAAATLALWVTPAVILMTAFAFGMSYLQQNAISLDFLRFIPAVAIGFIFVAAYKIGIKTVKDSVTIVLFLLSAVIAYFAGQPWVFPVILIVAGVVTNFIGKQEKVKTVEPSTKPNWWYLVLFGGIFAVAAILVAATDIRLIGIFETFYRFGSLIFGGGQVLIPFINQEVVDYNNWMTNEEFLTGFGMVQAVPGPVFSFSAFAGGMSMAGEGWVPQLLGSLVAAFGIFLPGILLIFFVYPFWNWLKQYPAVMRSLKGINAAAAGLVLAAAILLAYKLFSGFSFQFDLILLHGAIIIATFFVLKYSKIPAPLLVVVALVAGFIF